MSNNSESKDGNNSNNFDREIIEPFFKKREQIAEKTSKLKMEAKLAEEELNTIEQFLSFCNKKEFSKFLELHESKQQVFNRLFVSKDMLRESFNDILDTARKECIRIAVEYPALILEASQKAGVQIDETSMHPRYTFYDRFILLNIDDKKFKAKAYTREGALFVKPFDVQVVIESIKQEAKRLFGRKFTVKKFGKDIYSAYIAAVKKEKKEMGDLIPIREIFTYLKKSKKNFRTDEFIVDLSQFIKAGAPLMSGYKMELKQTKDDRMGILLYHYEANGYIGFISLNKEG
jgi:hypothetical protein